MLTRDDITLADADRFWARVDQSGGLDACWPWTGPLTAVGYGKAHARTQVAGPTQSAHRLSYILTHGTVPDSMHVCHRCDNRVCCNPSHLFAGTGAENSADMVAKGRGPRGERHGSRTMPERTRRGCRINTARLTERDIPLIRAAVAAGETQSAVAHRFRVSRATIGDVFRRHTWAHIP